MIVSVEAKNCVVFEREHGEKQAANFAAAQIWKEEWLNEWDNKLRIQGRYPPVG